MLSRQVLKSTYRVSDREIADQIGGTVEEVHDMEKGPIMMTLGLAVLVWQNTNNCGAHGHLNAPS